MLKVVDHQTGAATAYDTLPEALAVGRLLADQLALSRGLRVVVEPAGPGELLIGGQAQAGAGAAAGQLVPLVWVVSEMPPRGRRAAG
jgi:hypothetical protein